MLLHLQMKRQAEDIESLHFKVHTNCSLVIIIEKLVAETVYSSDKAIIIFFIWIIMIRNQNDKDNFLKI